MEWCLKGRMKLRGLLLVVQGRCDMQTKFGGIVFCQIGKGKREWSERAIEEEVREAVVTSVGLWETKVKDQMVHLSFFPNNDGR